MANTRRSSYKGYLITTRWTELMSDVRGPHRFNASFSVNPADVEESGWQQFETSVFDTSVAAADDALTSAKRSIDRNFSEK